ncbi:MAG: VOC family protein [bacterium]|nr:VOC family protein [bacterium]
MKPDCINRIDYVEIPAPDIAKAKDFYSDVFGWSMEDFGPDYCCFNDQKFVGGFTKAREIAQGGPLVIIYVADIEATMKKIEAAGGRQVVPKFAFPGGQRAHFADPSGNELAIWCDE